jgi:hypothetical protein
MFFFFLSVFVLCKAIDSNYYVSIETSFPIIFMVAMKFAIPSIISKKQPYSLRPKHKFNI